MEREHFILKARDIERSSYHPYIVATITERKDKGFIITYMYQRIIDGSQRWCEGKITYDVFYNSIYTELSEKDYKYLVRSVNINNPIEDLIVQLA